MARWFGGKFYMANALVDLMPEHACYVEPFCGAAWAYFKKTPSASEVLNDINGDIINLYEVVLRNPAYLVERMRQALASRILFERYRDMSCEEIEALSCEEQAWRLFYLIRLAFGGRNVCSSTAFQKRIARETGEKNTKPTLQSRKKNSKKAKTFPIKTFTESLMKAHERMAENTTLENLPYEKILKMYDAPTTFFYLDPPYADKLDSYGKGIFSLASLANLKVLLENIQGKFLLTMNLCEQTRELFTGFNLYAIPTVYTIRNDMPQKKTRELLVANFPPCEKALARHGVTAITI